MRISYQLQKITIYLVREERVQGYDTVGSVTMEGDQKKKRIPGYTPSFPDQNQHQHKQYRLAQN